MAPGLAIQRGLAGALDWSGRASRSEFWWFAPIGSLLPLVAWALLPAEPKVWHLAVVFAAMLPLLGAGARRLQDTGEDGTQVMLPVAPFVYFFTFLQLTSTGFDLTFGGTPWFIAWPLVILLWILFPFLCLFALFSGASVIGHLLVPSEPGTNRFGPTSLEARL
jgi:uncharacterized membrane protein YhaH (DUF805 family)